MNIDAIFEGGGVKGISFCGAITKLEEKEYQFNNLAGTSAGSIIASLLAVGYTGQEIKQILEKLDYNKFISKDFIQSIPIIGKLLGLLFEKGMYDSNYIETWINKLLIAKGKTKFKDVLDTNGKSRLKIIASDITRKEMIIFPDDLIKYGIDPMEFEIAKAVRMSCNIPLFYKPIKLKNNYENINSLVIDGGILSNYPIWIFDADGVPSCPTFGFKLISEDKKSSKYKVNIFNYIMNIINTIVDEDESFLMRDKDSVRTIYISTFDVSATDFNLSKEIEQKLYQSGYDSVSEFLETWDFQEYIKKYRIK